jgi:hypothetical protein
MLDDYPFSAACEVDEGLSLFSPLILLVSAFALLISGKKKSSRMTTSW